jgi:hypothetical protein
MRTALGRALAAATGVVVVLLTPTTTAHAQPINQSVSSEPVFTLADGPICGGTVRGLATRSVYRPGTVTFQVTGGFLGISGDNRPCWLGVSVVWRNLTTGQQGVVVGQVAGLMIPSVPTQVMSGTATTGAGRVEFSVQPHRPFIAVAPSVIDVS